MWAAWPTAWPDLSACGSQALFRRSQLKALVAIHSMEEGRGGTLSTDEISIIRGALDLSGKTASTCMTPLDKVDGCGRPPCKPFHLLQ